MFFNHYAEHAKFSGEKMVKVNLFESHRMFADLYCLQPGQEQRVHTHDDNDKVYFVLEGDVVAILGEEEKVLSQGESCVAKATEPHGVRNDSDKNVVLLVMMAPHPRLT